MCNACNSNGLHPLLAVVYTQDFELFKYCLNYYNKEAICSLTDKKGNNILHLAAKFNFIDAIEELGKQNILSKLNVKNKSGESPLTIATATEKTFHYLLYKLGFQGDEELEKNLKKDDAKFMYGQEILDISIAYPNAPLDKDIYPVHKPLSWPTDNSVSAQVTPSIS